MEGYDEKWKPGMFHYEGRTRVIGRYEVAEDAITGYFTTEIWDLLAAYSEFKKFGWPLSGGWAEQPSPYYDVVSALEDEQAWRQKN